MGYVIDNINLLPDAAKCIATQSSENCEVVLHDLMLPYNKTIVVVWNGHVIGKKIGDSGTNAGLQILKGSVSPDDQYHYINTMPDDKILRPSSKYFRGEYGKVNGSPCINLDITDLTKCQGSLRLLTCDESEPPAHNLSESFIGSTDGLLEETMNDVVSKAGKEIRDLTEEEKVSIVQLSDKKGFFLIKRSAEILVDFLRPSRYSTYNYLNETK